MRIIKGTSHRPLLAGEPRPRYLRPDPPEWLSPEARAEWDEIVEELSHVPGWLTRIDKSVLAWRCYWYARAVELARYLDANGLVYESLVVHPDDKAHGGGKSEVLETALKPRPEVKMLDDAWTHLTKDDQELGLTPSARTRVQARPFVSDDGDETGLDAM